MSTARKRLKEVFYETLGVLYKYVDKVTVIDYPSKPERRSIDVIVSFRGRNLLLKIVDDAAILPRADVVELAGSSQTLGIPGLIVSMYWAGEELADYVLYTLHGVPMISLATLEGILSGRGRIYIRMGKDGPHVSISGEKMKKLREAKGLSLGMLAGRVGVSRRTIYEYEKETLEPSLERGRRLLEVLGTEILDPIDVFSLRPETRAKQKEPDTSSEKRLIDAFRKSGGRVYHLKRSSTDIVASLPEEKMLFVVEHRRTSEKKAYSKAENTSRMQEILEARAVYVYREGRLDKATVENLGLTPLREGELESWIREILVRKKRESSRTEK